MKYPILNGDLGPRTVWREIKLNPIFHLAALALSLQHWVTLFLIRAKTKNGKITRHIIFGDLRATADKFGNERGVL